MSCLNPMLMLVCDTTKLPLVTYLQMKKCNWKFSSTDKKAYRLVSKTSRDHFLEMIPDYVNHSLLEVPCGGCVPCRLAYSKDWANRCTLEALNYDCNYFVTLTYDDDHLTYGSLGNPTINKKDLDDFIHCLRERLRRDFNHSGLRYFYCQEYGDQSARPHAHLILFNCPLPDLVDFFPQEDGSIIRQKNNMTGDFYEYSQIIKDCWNKGNILVANCNWNTNAYVSRYIMKKQKGKDGKVYKDVLGVEPPYIRASNRPGIGEHYLKSNVDKLINEPYLILPRDHKEPLVSGLPRYYKKKIFIDNPDLKEKWFQESIIKSDASRSLLKGRQLINDSRKVQEDKIIACAAAFNRDVN